MHGVGHGLLQIVSALLMSTGQAMTFDLGSHPGGAQKPSLSWGFETLVQVPEMTARVTGEGVQGTQTNRQRRGLCQETATSLKLKRPLSISLGGRTWTYCFKKTQLFPPGLLIPVAAHKNMSVRCQISQHNVFKLTVTTTRIAVLSNILVQAEKSIAAFLSWHIM